MNAILRRLIHPAIRVLDAAQGLVEYVASDESIDSYREVIRADGWRFTDFAKNAPFVDSHDYSSIDRLLGSVVDFRVSGRKLVETVKWAIDVPENFLAQKGFAMTQAGYLKAVSVGFAPVRVIDQWDAQSAEYAAAWAEQLKDLAVPAGAKVRAIYLEQEQKELSAVVVGANPNALARAYKAGVLSDEDLERFSAETARANTAALTEDPAGVDAARQRARTAFLVELKTKIKAI